MNKISALLLAGSLALSACAGPAIAAEEPVNAPASARIAKEGSGGLKTAIFAGGCFWGVEGVFSHVKGVKSAVSGFHGGNAASAKYNIITSGVTDHAEAVKVTYDPSVVRYDELLRIYFSVVADPTLKNRQGPDVGAHYRSALVPTSKEQAAVARAYLAQLGKAGLWSKPLVTAIEPYKAFYPAESYHQDFMAKNPRHGYIMRWDKPKVDALKALFPAHYRATFLRDAG
ncbi:peptide-methionine (S)-S-oxide reductase MsrA [Erythrobacter sp. NFXS35]|uniref:peptide-methionine (S)-S-oxide reductase MsrA n=1 Tax=Erythrobacter sp. NFXS35 TaxID=2818436 RepID=UPI0032E027B9